MNNTNNKKEDVIDYEQYVYPIAYYPDKQLREVCVAVPEGMFGSSHIKEQIKAMYTTMRYYDGVGIAAPQIKYEFKTGKPNRIIIVDIGGDKQFFVNPVIMRKEGTFTFNEGCLSLPGYYRNTTRANSILFVYRTIEGEHVQATATEVQSIVIQHEYDHLDGKLFIDDLSFIKRRLAENKIKKHIRSIERTNKYSKPNQKRGKNGG